MRLNTTPWKSPELDVMDGVLQHNGVELFDIDCSDLSRVDRDHFTAVAHTIFCDRLAAAVSAIRGASRCVHVYTDSTIDFQNWTSGYGKWHGKGSARLRSAMRRHGCGEVHVDAHCGSGLLAHPPVRVRMMSRNHPDLLVLVCGWNDARHSVERFHLGVTGLTRKTRASSGS